MTRKEVLEQDVMFAEMALDAFCVKVSEELSKQCVVDSAGKFEELTNYFEGAEKRFRYLTYAVESAKEDLEKFNKGGEDV